MDTQGELHYYSVRGLRLAYRTYGEAGGRPLLCFHGFLDHGASFRFMAEHLPEFRVVAPDVRGHGHSDWVGPGGYYHFYDYYDDARALLDQLGWSRFALLGHSMGGSIATGLAALEPRPRRRPHPARRDGAAVQRSFGCRGPPDPLVQRTAPSCARHRACRPTFGSASYGRRRGRCGTPSGARSETVAAEGPGPRGDAHRAGRRRGRMAARSASSNPVRQAVFA